MRKLLLACAAMGLSIGMAHAYTYNYEPPVSGGPIGKQTAPTEPGKVTISMGGLMNFYGAAASDSGSTFGGGKESTFRTESYVRLYPGIDGVLANGLKYGASIEIRMNTPGTTSASPGGNTTTNTLYARRAYVYFGTAQAGTVRLGPHYGPSGLMLTGNFEGFNDGAWNGDLPGVFTTNSVPSYPLPTTSALYSSNKIVYLSPNFMGFDFGVSYAPSTNAFLGGENCATAGSGACAYGSTSPLAAESGRRKDMIEAAVRYKGTFGAIGLATNATWIHAGHMHSSAAVSTAYKTQDVGDLGVEVSFAGFTVGGNYQFGSYAPGYALVPKGQKNSTAYLVGGQYATGPFTVGASYFNFVNFGSAAAGTGNRTDQGIAAGGTYALTPGVAIYLSYLYGMRHESGYDFLAGAAGAAHNHAKAQAISLGTVFRW